MHLFQSISTLKEILEAERHRSGLRQDRETEFDVKRRKQAERLMGDILSDTLDLPEDRPVRLMRGKCIDIVFWSGLCSYYFLRYSEK